MDWYQKMLKKLLTLYLLYSDTCLHWGLWINPLCMPGTDFHIVFCHNQNPGIARALKIWLEATPLFPCACTCENVISHWGKMLLRGTFTSKSTLKSDWQSERAKLLRWRRKKMEERKDCALCDWFEWIPSKWLKISCILKLCVYNFKHLF